MNLVAASASGMLPLATARANLLLYLWRFPISCGGDSGVFDAFSTSCCMLASSMSVTLLSLLQESLEVPRGSSSELGVLVASSGDTENSRATAGVLPDDSCN